MSKLLKSLFASALLLGSSHCFSQDKVTITDNIDHEKDLVLETRLEADEKSPEIKDRIMTLTNHRTLVKVFDYNNDGFGKNDYVRIYHKSKKGDEIEAEVSCFDRGEYKANYKINWDGASSVNELDTSRLGKIKKVLFLVFVNPLIGDFVRYGSPIYSDMTKYNTNRFPIREFNHLIDEFEQYAPGLASDNKKDKAKLKDLGREYAEKVRKSNSNNK